MCVCVCAHKSVVCANLLFENNKCDILVVSDATELSRKTARQYTSIGDLKSASEAVEAGETQRR